MPTVVTRALEEVDGDGDWYFWTGRGSVRTITANWQRYLSTVFELSGMPGCHSHRFRDTAAVTWLLKGVRTAAAEAFAAGAVGPLWADRESVSTVAVRLAGQLARHLNRV